MDMIGSELTDRQIREREFYEEYSRRNSVTEVNFEPVAGKEKRPWNSYWYLYQLAREKFNQGNHKLLDYGCGSGVSSVRFAALGYEVKAFDISPNNIRIAQELAGKYAYEEKIEFSVQSAEQLTYALESFDIIIGTDILHHVDIERSIQECHRLLKKGGVAIFREHVEVPVFDYLRNTRIFKMLFPKTKSFERHITEDERKLTADDLKLIKAIFHEVSEYRFLLFSRLDRFIRKPQSRKPSFLEKVDHVVIANLPGFARFGGEIILVLHK